MKKLLPAVTGVTPPNRHSTRTKPSRRHGASAPGRIVTLLCHFVTGGVTATARVGRARDARDTLVRVRELRVLLTREPERKCHARHGVTPRGSAELLRFANEVWEEINLPNLLQNILPTRGRARLILEKGPDHLVRRVLLRRA